MLSNNSIDYNNKVFLFNKMEIEEKKLSELCTVVSQIECWSKNIVDIHLMCNPPLTDISSYSLLKNVSRIKQEILSLLSELYFDFSKLLRCQSYNVVCKYFSSYDISNGIKMITLYEHEQLLTQECMIKYNDYKNKLERLEIHKNLSEKWFSIGNIVSSIIKSVELMEENQNNKFQTMPMLLGSDDKFHDDFILSLQKCLKNISVVLKG